ncbi:MAG: acetyl-CoA carboxylase biotin carboxyl carrier protein [Acidobacteriota bacterium]|nr:acetyl-CoA carboxylase biotin carboxyl carrier protein [Acidobacteriota bacterium]
MTIDEIRKLIEVVRETGISELEVQQGENRVRIRSGSPVNQDIVLPAVLPVTLTGMQNVIPATPSAPLLQDNLSAAVPTLQPPENDRNLVVKSPIVGTYYDSPSPGVPPFVKIGDHVEAKQVICIIESMKLMNEIEAEVSGIIVAKFVENGRPVEYGQSLFTINPL